MIDAFLRQLVKRVLENLIVTIITCYSKGGRCE